MSFSFSPRMLLHTYTEPQWLLPPTSESSSLDRLESAEAAHWEAIRVSVLPESTAVPMGLAADETKTFGWQASGASPAVDVSQPVTHMTLQTFTEKYGHQVTTMPLQQQQQQQSQSSDLVLDSPLSSIVGGRQSAASMDMSMSLCSSSLSLAAASPTSRTG